MFDVALGKSALQRARGRAVVGFGCSGGRTRLAELFQSGSAKAMLPRVPGDPEVVFLNTAGGLTGGDRFDYDLHLAAGARATATTQTAERAYASTGDSARVRCRMTVGAGARLDWLPQETILFDRAAFDRNTRIELAGDARLLFCETLVFGRAAMGETVAALKLSDRREIFRDGRPVLTDAVRIGDAALERRDGAAMLAGARAVALVALVAPGAEDAAGPAQAAATFDGVTAEASGWNGRCLVRLAAPDLWPLRQAMVRVLSHFRGTVPPRVWQI